MTAPSVLFICWGNICRSPMAERVAREHAARRGVDATFTSRGLSAEEEGNRMDRRAHQMLAAAGYDGSGHVAHQVREAELRDADLVVVAEPFHIDRIARSVSGLDTVRLITDFDPEATPGSGIADPWYGDLSGFEETLAAIESAMPGLLDEVERISESRAA